MIRWAGALLLVANVATAQEVPRESQPPERIVRARAAYDEGAAAFQEGRFGEALDRFSVAYELSARAELLYNIGAAHDRLGRRDDALSNYRVYLEALPHAGNRAYTEARIVVLEREAMEAQIANDARTLEVDPVDDDPVDSDPTDAAEPSESSGGANIPAIALLVGVGVVGVSSIVTGVMALGQRSDLEGQCPGLMCDASHQDDIDRLQTLAITTDVLIGVAAVAAIASVVLFVVRGGDEDDASLTCGMTGCTARVVF